MRAPDPLWVWGEARLRLEVNEMGAMAVLSSGGLAKVSRRDAAAPWPVSHLGWGLTVTGWLECAGEVRIQGTVLGRIDADCVVIGLGGMVEGDIIAREVRVSGRLTGRIFAPSVVFGAEAEMSGRVFHHMLSVEKGARIDARMPWRPMNYFDSLDQLPETRS